MFLLLLGLSINLLKIALAQLGYVPNHLTSSYLGGAGRVTVSFMHFVTFDAFEFIRRPFVILGINDPYFAFFLRSMIYGEYKFQHSVLGSILNASFLIFLGAFFIGTSRLIYTRRKHFVNQFLPHLVYMLLLLASSITFMALKRMDANSDFRFCFPLCIPLAIVFGHIIETCDKKYPSLRYVYAGIAVCFMSLGVLFYVAQYAW